MNILITGGCGFVGRHFSKRLSDDGHKVVCVDNCSSDSSLPLSEWPSHLAPNANVEVIYQDCREYFKAHTNPGEFDIIFHLAAVVGGREMIENQPILVGTDLSIDAEMFQWATVARPQKIVYFSSSAAYPISLQTETDHRILCESMIDFTHPSLGMPDITYGWAKLTGEFLAKIAHTKAGLNVVCYRPFSGYGEDQHKTYPFPAILNRCINREETIQIWSDSVRDFVYIEDVVDCVLNTMDHISNGDAINIATGIPTSFSSLAKKMCKMVGHEAEISILQDKCKGVYYRVGDTEILTKFGFVPKYTLEDGIRRCIELKESTYN